MVINNEGSDPVYSLRDLTTHKPSVGVSYALCAMCCVQHSYRITSAALLGIYHGPSAFVNEETKPCQIKTFPEIHNHEVVEFTFRPLFPDVNLYAVLPPEGFPIHFSPLSNQNMCKHTLTPTTVSPRFHLMLVLVVSPFFVKVGGQDSGWVRSFVVSLFAGHML